MSERTALSVRMLSALLLVCANAPAFAGDEVDYSAPYLTVENGELVTKYPLKEHQDDRTGTDGTMSAAAPKTHSGRPGIMQGLLVLLAATLVALIWLRRRKRQRTA